MIIVTGGAGFIGSNLVRGLNQKGIDEIIIVDNLTHSIKHKNLNRLKFIDFIDKDVFLDRLSSLGKIDAIFHQGACSSTTETNGRYMMENNFEYSKRLFHHALSHKTPFFYASSASVYGNGDHGFIESTSCENPLNIYAFSKWMFDQYVRRFLPQAPMPLVGLRYFNVYGSQECHKNSMASVGYHLFQQSLTQKTVQLFEGSPGFKRDFIFVEDVVKLNLFCWEQGLQGIYNAGTGHARSFFDIANTFQQIHPIEIEYIPFPAHLKGKYQVFTQANLDLLKTTGYPCQFISLEEGLNHYFKQLGKNGGYLD